MQIVAFFIRHGDTDFNEKEGPGHQERFRGDLDIPLNEAGHKQAEELVPYFAAREFSAAFHSGMQRTAQTLEPLMDAKGMESIKVEGLDSLDTEIFLACQRPKRTKRNSNGFVKIQMKSS